MIRRTILQAALWAALLPVWGAEGTARLTVLSYNIHHGAGMDGVVDLRRIAGVIQSANPDVVAVQEVDRGTKRTGGVDQAAELERLTGLKAFFGRSIDYEGGQYGNAILTRLPLRGAQVHPLPGVEPRSVIEARLEFHGQPLIFLATHLDSTRPEEHRIKAAQRIAELAESRGETLMVLAGDLNTTLEREPMQILGRVFRVAGGEVERPTVPVGAPKRQIDFILYRPERRWKVVEVRVLEEAVASDHRPIAAVLHLTAE
jgi:endonuclease/exonuclease/phosphatase family metal-dependent hydrolase